MTTPTSLTTTSPARYAECFGVEFANCDVGPFATRDLAEMYAWIEGGAEWPRDARIFRYAEPQPDPIVALVGPTHQSRQVAFWMVSKRDLHRYGPKAAA